MTDISKTLENIQNQVEKIKNKKAQKIVLDLYNLVEKLVSKNTNLTEENQALKNEINELKGEQGKPVIKPNKKKDGNISSEDERKEAEASVDKIDREGFKLNKSTLEKLKDNKIPEEVLEQLKNLTGKKYSNKAEFKAAIKSAIGNDLTNKHINTLANHARYLRRNRNPKIT